MLRPVLGLGALLLVSAALALWLVPTSGPVIGPVRYHALAFEDLAGWAEADHDRVRRLFLDSCPVLQPRDDRWAGPCTAAKQPGPARHFFERQFRPVAVRGRGRGRGLITGYYLPQLNGRTRPAPGFETPLYGPPPDLVKVDLGRFRPHLAGQRLAGRVVGGQLQPLPDRAQIDAGALAGQAPILYWVDDPVAAFFLHIQGSGQIRLPDGRRHLVGYAAANGHPYRSLGRLMIDRGLIARDDLTAQSIAAWLRAHPEAGALLMAENPSFIFFRKLNGARPLGSLGVPLTAEVSLAVDPGIVPLGAPVWLDTRLTAETGRYRRLMLAQDTGGAIRGANRADIYFGPGDRAWRLAGAQNAPGRTILLLPPPIAAPLTEAGR